LPTVAINAIRVVHLRDGVHFSRSSINMAPFR
jgi:hypothetical protein